MIRRDELKQSQAGIKIKGGAGKVSYETIQAAIAAKAEEYGIPVAFENDVIRSGGLFNKQEEPCLVLYHPEHPHDYFRNCITFHTQGIVAYIDINYYGFSALTGQKNTKEERESSDSFGRFLLGKLTKVDSVGYEAEYSYYDAIKDIIEEAFS